MKSNTCILPVYSDIKGEREMAATLLFCLVNRFVIRE